MKSLRAGFQNWLLVRGYVLHRRDKTTDINELLRMIWPSQTNSSLVRVGSETTNDGGYLLPDDLEGIARVFSPGVADSMEFEKYFLELGIPCELIDGSISNLPFEHELANFEPLWLSRKSDMGSIKLSDWVDKRAKKNEDLILQMDIEGAEYECLLVEERETIERFRIIVIELHNLRQAFSPLGSVPIKLLITKLQDTHNIVHAHPNNCCPPVGLEGLVWPDVLELTFLRKDRGLVTNELARLPHWLDKDNTKNSSLSLKHPDFYT